MLLSRSVPLVRASVFEPFIEAARQIGAPIEKAKRAAGLPAEFTDTTENPEQLLPEIPCWRFAQSVARTEGLPDFGLLAGKSVPHQDISTLTPLITDCTNLLDLLKRFLAVAPLQCFSARYALKEAADQVWFIHKGERLIPDDVQVQLCTVLGMVQLVRLAAGQDWHPPEIHFSFKRIDWLEPAEEFGDARILFSRRYPSIAIPPHLLALPLVYLHQPSHHRPDGSPELAPLPDNFADSLRNALIPYIGEKRLDRDFVAQVTGLSPRTLHRRLARQGTSYLRVLEQARLMKASSLLRDTDQKLLEISFLLGYRNAPAFSRAFRRWTGISPREYRKLNSAA